MGHSITAIILKGDFVKEKAKGYDLSPTLLDFGLSLFHIDHYYSACWQHKLKTPVFSYPESHTIVIFTSSFFKDSITFSMRFNKSLPLCFSPDRNSNLKTVLVSLKRSDHMKFYKQKILSFNHTNTFMNTPKKNKYFTKKKKKKNQ